MTRKFHYEVIYVDDDFLSSGHGVESFDIELVKAENLASARKMATRNARTDSRHHKHKIRVLSVTRLHKSDVAEMHEVIVDD